MEKARKEKRGKFQLRWVAIGCFAIAAIAFGILIPKTVVNYDMTKYLPEDAISKMGYDVYSEEFGGTHMAKLMVRLSEGRTAETFLAAFNAVKDETDGAIGTVTLQDQKAASDGTETALFVVIFDGMGTDAGIHAAVDKIRDAAGEDAVVCGSVIDDIATAEFMLSSALLASVILIPVVIGLVLLTTKSFMSLLLILVTLGVSIVINMGTNFLLPEVSFITQGITLALQLAITLDYAIFMIHEYERQRADGVDSGTAVRRAIKKSFTSICSAFLTTIAGFVALMFMRFSIGIDLGIVFIKGILFSFASVILLLPSLLLVFDKAVTRTVHRPFMPKFEKSARGIYKARYVFVFLIVLLIPALILQGNLQYTFGSAGLISGEGVPSYDAKLEIAEVYGNDNSLILVLPKDADRSKEGNLEAALAQKKFEDGRPMFRSVTGIGTVQGYVNASVQEKIRGFSDFLPSLSEFEFQMPFCSSAAEYMEKLPSALVASGIPEEFLPILTENEQFKTILDRLSAQLTAAFANFESADGSHAQIILSADTVEESGEAFLMYETVLDEIKTVGLETGEGKVLPIGETPSAYDMKTFMTADQNFIFWLSIAMVFVIILITFRSLSLPVLLILPILTGIFINSAIPAVTGTHIAFLGNLVVSMIQLGATIDYAILYANKYCVNRRTMLKPDAAKLALKESIPSILTSAIALTVAGFAIGWTAVLPATSQIGFMLGRAGLLSAFLTIFVLPGMLCFCDPVIEKTSLGLKFLKPPAKPKGESFEEDDDD